MKVGFGGTRLSVDSGVGYDSEVASSTAQLFSRVGPRLAVLAKSGLLPWRMRDALLALAERKWEE